MPLYLFHVMDGRAIIDSEGTAFGSIGDVRTEAVRLAGAILHKEQTGLQHGSPWLMTVADAAGDTVFSLTFKADHHGY